MMSVIKSVDCQLEDRVLLLAPTEEDGRIMQAALAEARIECSLCKDLAGVCDELGRGAGAIVLAEEALTGREADRLPEMLRAQPSWSDLPILVLTAGRTDSPVTSWAMETMGGVLLLDRPLGAGTLLTAVRMALRSRQRQMQVREHLAERNRAEEALRQNAENYRAVFELAGTGVGRADPRTGRFIQVNRKLCEMLGYSAEELCNKTFSEITHPDDREISGCGVQKVIRGELPEFLMDKRYLRKDGSALWVHVSVTLVRDIEGQPLYLIGMVQDITERKGAEEALQKQRTFYRQILDTDRNLLFVKDEAGRFVVVNQAMAELYGKSRDELIGRFNRDLLPEPRDYARYDQIDQQVLRTKQVVTVEEVHQCREGPQRWYMTTKAPIQLPDGRIGVLGVAADITERKEAEERVRLNEARLRQIIDLVPHMIFAKDREGTMLLANQAVADAYGLTVEQVVGKKHGELHKDDAELQHMLKDDREVIDSGRPKHIPEETYLRASGERRILETIKVPYTASGTTTPAIVGVAVDITARKKAEKEMMRARQEAEAANNAKDHFLAVLSHELRTPLAPILPTVQMMEADAQLPRELREAVSMIHRNIELEARLIDDLLDLTRISRGKLELHCACVDVHERLRHVLEMCQSEITGKQLNVQLEESAAEHHVLADGARLQQILWNLVKNAVKFTPPGGKITVRTENGGDRRLSVTVQDTGVGIEKELLPRLFNAFEQGGKDVTRQFGGLGLGLAISKGLTDLHGGTLTAESEGKGKGAKFELRLPVSVAPEHIAPRESGPPGRAPSHEKRRVLLVEDHADTRNAMARLLESFGYVVRTADCVAAALQAAQADVFDVALCDIGLPDGSGIDLMRQLKSSYPIQGIALSGFGREEDLQKSREAGFAEHLIKPIDVQQLEAAIHRCCDNG